MMSFDFYALIVFVHILAGALLMGSSLLAPVARSAIRSAHTVAELRSGLGIARGMALANPIAALAVLGTGVYLGSMGWWYASWFDVALVVFVSNSLIALLVVKPLGRRLGKLVGGIADGAVPPEAHRARWSPAWDVAAGAMVANDLAVLFIMIRKPEELMSSIAIALVANAAVLLIATVARVLSPRVSGGSECVES